MTALYREHAGADWQEAELVGRHRSGALVLREVGKVWPGVWLASIENVRVPAAQIALQLEIA